ncbi:MAG: KH domain-containing protein [Candidatus Babeliales bacterium]
MFKALIEQIVKRLVDKPESVVVKEVEGEQATVIELRVAPEDLGKVIGKEGRTARSLRTLVHAVGIKEKRRVVLEILE